jgi:hypothetical protein
MSYKVEFSRIYNISAIKAIAILTFIGAIAIASWVLIRGNYLTGGSYPDVKKAQEIVPFISALVTPLLTVGTTLLVIENLKITTRQNFSNNFFKLLEYHHRLVENISDQIFSISDGDGKSSAKRVFFEDLSWRMAYDYENISIDGKGVDPPREVKLKFADKLAAQLTNKTGKEKLNLIYSYYYEVHHSILGHYMRNLHKIVNYANTWAPNRAIRHEHINLLLTQLSNYELVQIAYYSMQGNNKSFYEAIKPYHFFREINFETNLHAEYQRRIIDPTIIKTAFPECFPPENQSTD